MDVELREHLLRHRLEGATVLRQPDPRRATVGRIALPPDEAGPLGEPDERRHRLLGQPGPRGEGTHAQAVVLEER